jgi:hypothetical protein
MSAALIYLFADVYISSHRRVKKAAEEAKAREAQEKAMA